MPLETYSKSDLVLTQRHHLETPLLWVILLATASFALAEGNPVLLVVGLVGFAVNYAAVLRRTEIWVHRVWINLAVLGATIVLLAELFLADTVHLLALGHYMTLIVNCKLFERKRNRDYMQMLLLSLLLMVAASVITDAIWLAPAMLAYLLLTCYTAMAFTIKRGLESASQRILPGEHAPPDPEQVAWKTRRKWPGRALAGRAAGAVLVLLIAGACVLIASPRMPQAANPLLGTGNRGRQTTTTGFSEEVVLGGSRQIYESSRIVGSMRIWTRDDTPPPINAFYLRGKVYNAFTGEIWRYQSGADPGFEHLPSIPRWLAEQAYEVDVEISAEYLPTIFAPYPALEVASSQGTVNWAAGMSPRLNNVPDYVGQVRYTVWALPIPADRGLRRYLRRMRISPPPAEPVITVPRRVEQLARQWCHDLLAQPPSDHRDVAIAARLATRLKDTCSYSLDLAEADPTRSPLEDFLFYMKKGHCEYFASAHVAMCRVLGVRARLATGFFVSPGAGSDDRWAIRQSDAHAWSEIYTDQTDWYIVDATPAGRERARQRRGLGILAGWWEDLEFWWHRNVVQFDTSMRDRIAWWIQQKLEAAAAAVTNAWSNAVDLVQGRKADLIQAAATLGVLVVSIGLVVLAARMVRAPDPRSQRRNFSALPRSLRQLLEQARRRGSGWRINQSLSQWAQEACDALGLDREQLDVLIAEYYRLRYSGLPAAPETIDRIDEKARQLRRQLSGRKSRLQQN
ncbi:MAG: DUF3488 and DUF4129 domain-containing transglutaminase family protein [Phycisphaerae bacterium]